MDKNIVGAQNFSREEHSDVQGHLLPIANVGRIMKQALPPNAKISQRAKETMQECASEFINFITGEASDRCLKEKRKTINGEDICYAMKALGLDEYADVISRYLHKYRASEERATSLKQKKGIQIGVRDELSNFSSDQSGSTARPLARSLDINDPAKTSMFL
ncbi:transcriptional activator hap3-like [Ananas comosus]|uniref:Transcriptional activator hap3-like n=1 Tax=Ananas comosus TaxID=4615 RepID=A0A6P5ERG8_ANACO|nr:transcriptional activator hap3-like [Ananas comosus]